MPARPGLSPRLTLRLIAAFLAVLIAWFGYWELGEFLARLGLPHWPLPMADTQGYLTSISPVFTLLVRLMIGFQILALVLVLRRDRRSIWALIAITGLHLTTWVWITYDGWFGGGPGFYIIIGETLSIYALLRLRAIGELR